MRSIDDSDEALAIVRGYEHHLVTAVLAGVYLLVAKVTPIFILPGIGTIDPAIGLVLPAGLIFGLPGGIGVAIGHFFRDWLLGVLGPITVSTAIAFLFTAIVAGYLWSAIVVRQWKTDRPSAAFARATLVGIAAIATGVATISLGMELVGVRPFFASVIVDGRRMVLSTILVGIPVLIFVIFLRGHIQMRQWPLSERGAPWLVIILPLVWVLLAGVGSLGFHIAGTIHDPLYAQEGLEILTILINERWFGRGAVRVQSLLGGFVLTALIMLVVLGSEGRPLPW